MPNNSIIERVLKHNLCLGCGLCSSVLGEDKCRMYLSEDGFYMPDINDAPKDHLIKQICPGITIHHKGGKGIWGNIISLFEGWSADDALRHKAASGGVVSSVAIYMLESGLADAVLQVGVKDNHYLYNELKVSRNKQDIVNNAQSRYAPALTLVKIKQILDSSSEKYVFIGKPCDIAGIRNLINVFPEYESRFVLLISIFCAGMPSYNATDKTWKMSGRQDTPSSLKYRGDGWPGHFRAIWHDGQKFELTYNESWGKVLGKQVCFRCKICPEGIGMLADIAVGDSWNTKNGYPDFTESEGRCFVMVRTERGQNVVLSAEEKGYLKRRNLDVEKIRSMQPYQYLKRKMIGWRILPVNFMTHGFLNFNGFGLYWHLFHTNYLKGLKIAKGTIKRFMNRPNWKIKQDLDGK